MKNLAKIFLLLVIFNNIFQEVQGQTQVVPNGILFQAVARDFNGNAAISRTVYANVTILKGSATGVSVYAESFQVTSTAEGIFTIVIGNGKRISGAANLNAVDWASALHFLNLKIAIAPTLPSPIWTPDNEFIDLGTSQFWSVPYTFSSQNARFSDSASNLTTILTSSKGGTGVNNNGKTITLGNNIITKGIGDLTITTTAASNVIFPTSGTLATIKDIGDILKSDTISLSNRINTKLDSSQFPVLIAPYLQSITGVKYSDTSQMLTNYRNGITTNTNSIATNTADILLRATIASPSFTGTPTAPTPLLGSNSTQIATTAYVANYIAPDADANNKGKVQLTGDLGGTAGSPLVKKIGGKTVVLGGDLTTTGNYTTTINTVGNTNITLPTSGTIATLSGTESLTNKTINGVIPTALANGFNIAGGTITSTTLTVVGDVTVGGVNSGDQLITLIGDASGSGTGTFTTTINSVGGISSTTIGTLPTLIASNTTSITSNTISIASNTTSITANTADILLRATIASPSFTGTPTAPTAAFGTSTSQIATTAFVSNLVGGAATPEADAFTKGKLQLAGDLGGTAASPLVNKIGGNPIVLGGALTTAGSFTTAGNYSTTINAVGNTNVTLPTSGTIATLSGTESLTNKTINGIRPTALANGFNIAGGTITNTTLTVVGDVTVGGVNSGDQLITLIGDVSGSGTGTFATTINSVGGISSTTIGTLPTLITSNSASITSNTNAIASNSASITSNTNAIASNTASITSNTNAIASNTASITSNTNAIASNSASIAAETIRATNVENNLIDRINLNTNDITSNTNSIAANTLSITSNTNSIAANTASITAETTRATNAENLLSTRITSNTTSITAEILRATSAEGALDTRVTSNTASITSNTADILLRATIASPSFTGTPTAPTAAFGTSTSQIATTAFVSNLVGGAATPDADAVTKGKVQLAGDLGGTAGSPLVNKIGGNPIVLGGALITAGSFSTFGNYTTTINAVGNTNVTLPTSGTIATLSGTESLTNKSINGITPSSLSTGFTLSGGNVNSKILTVLSDVTLGGVNTGDQYVELIGDVKGGGFGTFTTTVSSVGGVSSSTIATLPSLIASNTSSITSNTNAISANTVSITSNTSAIASNTASITANTADILLRATIASPSFTGTPTAPTAAPGNNSTQLANTSFVASAINNSSIDATQLSGIVSVANGGTGQSSFTDGQLLIGNSNGNTLSKSTLTAGNGVSITNGNGSIEISVLAGTGGIGTVSSVGPINVTTGGNTFSSTVLNASTTPAITLNIPSASVSGTTAGLLSNSDYANFNSKVASNATITGDTKTKITYDAKGLVISGANATTADIAPSSDRLYLTNAQSGLLSNTSGINTGDQTITLTGDVTGTGTGTFTTTIANASVSYAKMQNISGGKILGSINATPAAPGEITVGSGLTLTGNTLTATGTGGTVTNVNPIIVTTNGNTITSTVSNSSTTPGITLNIPSASVSGTTAGLLSNADYANFNAKQVALTAGLGISISGGTISATDATTAAKGIIKLANDLGGTADMPTVNTVGGIISTTIGTLPTLIASNTSSITAEITRATIAEAGLDTRVTSNTASISSNTADILLRATIESPSFTGTPTAPTAVFGTSTSQIATTAFVSTLVGGSATPDADALTKGKIQLTGDLGGSAGSPLVNKIGGKDIVLGGAFTTAGNYTTTINTIGNTSITLPTTGTIATINGTESFTNKTINGVRPTALANGFTIAGGTTTNTTLTVVGDVTVGGINSGDQLITLIGDVIGSGTGTFTTTINSVGGISSTTIGALPTLIAANTASITSNTNSIATNTSSITSNTNSIATNTASITSNTNSIAANTASITSNTNSIAANTASITSNTNSIFANTASITSNTNSIAANTASITSNTNSIAVNTASITSNTNSIAANTASITSNTNAIAANTASITAEITRATNAESSLSTRVSSNTNSITANTADILLRSTIASPSFTGTPTAPTADPTNNSTQLANTSFVTTAISNMSLGASQITGVIKVENGGTGQSSFTDGQLLIGNSIGNTLTKATLTGGNGVSITNGNGSIAISVLAGSGGIGTVTNVNPITVNASGNTFTSTVANGNTTPTISLTMPLASVAGTTAGLLSNAEYDILNAKQGALTAGSGIVISGGTISATDATTSSKGIIKLANDLGGSAELPIVNSVGGVLSSTINMVSSNVLSATSSNTANTIVKRDGSGNFAANTITATAITSGTLTLTTPLAITSGGTGTNTATGSGSVVLSSSPSLTGTPTAVTADASSNSTQIATTAFVAAKVGGSVTLDADAVTKGKLKLTNDLGGTADLPVVNSVGGVSSSTITTIPTLIASNTASITSNTNSIAANTASITNNTNSIAANTLSITSNTNSIAANTASITSNTNSIAANTASITSNTNSIAANTASITSNTNSIAANTASITSIASSVNSATSSNIVNTIVKRDGSGNFAASTITATAISSGTLTLTTPLAITSGGTGTNTATGSGSVVLSTSPALTGTPTAITAAPGTNTNQIATTEFVAASITSQTVQDADAVTKGKLKLANDLGGTADMPVVNSVGGVSSSTITTVASNVLSATSTNTPNTIVKRDGSGGFSTGTITGTLSGTASNANALTTGRTISTTGDITYTSSPFDGTANVTGVGTLTNTGVTANTYGSSTYTSTSVPTITVDSKGRITSASTTNIPSATSTITGLLSSTDFATFNAKQGSLTAGSGISILGGTISATGITSANLSSTAGITNGQLANSSVTLGTTAMSLGGTYTNVTGLSSVTSDNFTGTLSGTASNANALTNGRTISITGDITYTSPSFDGTSNVTGVGILTNTGVTANTYGSSTYTTTSVPIITVDSKGRITSAINTNIPSATNTVTGLLTSTDYAIFNSKQAALTAGSGISISGGTISATGITSGNLSATAGILNTQLANSSITLGSIAMSLGGTYTNVTGLSSVTSTNFTGTLSGTASGLTTSRTISTTGDITSTGSFDGTANLNLVTTLANTGVISNTYGSSAFIPKITVDTKGRVTNIEEVVVGASAIGAPLGANKIIVGNSNSIAADVYMTGDVAITNAGVTSVNSVGGVLSSTITTLPTLVASNTASITSNTNSIAANTASITSNTNSIAANTASITSNTNSIAANTASITNNTNSIAANTVSITSNTNSIAANTASITSNTNSIAANTASITSNTNSIAANTASITSNTNSIAANTASITSIASAVNSATSSNIVNTIVKRDGSGNFAASTITATAISSGTLTLTTPLAITSGGTGTNTATGSGSVVLSTSPALTGTPTAITAAPGTNTNQIATTEFVAASITSQTVQDADAVTKGKLKLANDLGGTADLPVVNSVGGVSSSTITTVSSAVNSATSSNTANTIVKRDVSGGFAAGLITATSLTSSGNISSISLNTGTLTTTSLVTNTLKVIGGAYTATGAVLTTDGTGNAIWNSSGLYTLNGITASSQAFSTTTAAISTSPSFTSSGTVHTLNIPSASVTGTTAGLLSNTDYNTFSSAITSATASNTANMIVKRDGSGGFAAGVITATSLISSGNISSTSLNTGTITATTLNTGIVNATNVKTTNLNVTAGLYDTNGAVLTSDGSGNAVWGSSGLYTLNGINSASQTFATSTSPTTTIPSFTSSGTVHTLNIPYAGVMGTLAGLLSNNQYQELSAKQGALTAGTGINIVSGTSTATISANDATSTAKGIIQLTNDLGGTAAVPVVNSVGGVLSSTITTVSSNVLSATSSNTANTIVRRDGSGGFAAGLITATSLTSTGNISSTSLNTGTLTTTSLVTNTLRVTGGTLTPNAVLTSDAFGNATWGGSGLYTLNGITAASQTFSTTTASTSAIPLFTSSGTVHTLNIPSATVTGTIAGLLSNADYLALNAKQGSLVAGSGISISGGVISATGISSGNLSSTAGILNTQLANSSITLGATAMSLGGTYTSVTGLSLLTTTALKITGGTYTTTGAVLTNDGTGNAVWGSSGLYTLNGITAASQTFSTTTASTSAIPTFTSSGTVHTLNIPSASITGTTAGLLSNAEYAALNAKQVALTAGAGIIIGSGTISATDATSTAKGIIQLTNDLGGTAAVPVVNSVGGVLSSTITTVSSAVNSATSSNTANMIVKRDGTGGFAAGLITATSLTSTGNISSTSLNTGTLTTTSLVTNTLRVTGGTITPNAVLTSDAFGNATWGGSGLYTLNGITAAGQTFSTTTASTSTSPSFTSTGTVHILNIPSATVSGTTAGLLSNAEYITITANSGVISGTYGSSSVIPKITVDAKGRVTSLEEVLVGASAIGAPLGTNKIIVGNYSGTATDVYMTGDVGIISTGLTTVNSVGGVSSSTITTVASNVLSATSSNTANTIVKRDGSGGFAAGLITATSLTSTGNISSTSLNTGTITSTSLVTNTLRVTGGTLTPNAVLTSDAYGNATWGGSGLYTLNGITAAGQTFSTTTTATSTSPSFTSSGTVHTLNIPSATVTGTIAGLLSNTDYNTFSSAITSATASNTANTIVKRDGSGGFAAGLITATSLTSSGNISSTSINTGTLTTTSLVTNTLRVTGGTLTPNAVLTSDAYGNATWGSNGLYTLNGITAAGQTFSTTTTSASTIPSFTSNGTVHTLNIPYAGVMGTLAGLLSNNQYQELSAKQGALTAGTGINILSGTSTATISATDATSIAKGIIQLTNDLGGTAAMPVVNSVGGVLSSTITTVSSNVLSATASNTANTIVKRDGSGGFDAGLISVTSLTSTGNISSTSLNTGTLTSTSLVTNTLRVTGGTLTPNAVLTSDAFGNATWGSNGLYTLNGITAASQTFSTTNINSSPVGITSSVSGGTATHTFNIPDAYSNADGSGVTRGLLSSGTQNIGGQKSFTASSTYVKNLIADGTVSGTQFRLNSNSVSPIPAYTVGSVMTSSDTYGTATWSTNLNVGTITATSLTTGSLKVTSGTITPSAVLTSDAYGNATWGSNGLYTLNGITAAGQTFSTTTTATSTSPSFTSSGTVHTLNIPSATVTGTIAGLLSNTDYNTFSSAITSATASNTANTIVKRDGSGGFAAGLITATSLTSSGNISSTSINTGTLTTTSLVTNTLRVTGGTLTPNAVLTSDAYGNATWGSNGLYTLNGITAAGQTFSTTTTSASTIPTFTSSGTVHILNIPYAGVMGTIAGLLSNAQYQELSTKQGALSAGTGINIISGTSTATISATDATSTAKGIIQLTNDLGGTAAVPLVNSVGGVSSSTITTVASNVLSATSINTANTIVRRDGSGGFDAGLITATSLTSSGNISSTSINTGTLTTTSLVTNTIKVTGGTITSNAVLTSDAYGNATWGSNGLYTLNGITAAGQTFSTTTTSATTIPTFTSSGTVHTLNIPYAGVMGTVAGLLSNDQYQELYAKQNALTLATGIQTFLATPTSSNLAAAISDEAGSSSLVFSNNPTLTNTTLTGTLTLTAPLSVANGGTGTNTYLKGDILYASAANTLSKLPIGTEGQVLLTSSSLVPVWGSNGVYSLNGQSAITHTLTSSTFSITSATSSNTATHTFSLLDATASNRGLMSTADQIFEGNKTFNKDINANSTYFGRGNSQGTNSPGIAYNLSIGVGSKNFSTNTSGNYNIAIGASSLITLAGGTNNNAVGFNALKFNTAGSSNNAIGANALSNNTSGNNNTAVGEGALSLNAGSLALGYGSDNTAVGFASLTSNVSGYQNTAIGSTSGVAANNLSNATAIGYGARVNADNTIQLGNTSVTSVVTSGTLSATGATVANLKLTRGTPTVVGAVLTATATDGTVGWSTNSSATSLSGGVAGAIPFQTAPSVTGFTAAGTSGQLLVSGGTATPTWTSNITMGTVTATSASVTTLNATSLVLTGNLTATSANFSRAVTGAPAAAFTSASTTTIDFSSSNLAYSGQSSKDFTLSNLRDGGTYTLAWQNTTTGLTATFTSAGFSFVSLGNYAVVTGKNSVYTFVVMGSTVYYSMVSAQ